jgi:predicted transcriptional regulator
MSRRSRMQIIYDLLNAIIEKKGKIKVTHLLYKGNLSHERLKLYLEELEQKGFIQKIFEEGKKKRETGKTYYTITDKGVNFLNEVQRVQELTEAFGL